MSLLLHDLRSPLSAICGCAEMLLDGNLGPADSRRVASNVHRAAGRMRDLIGDLGRIAHRGVAIEGSADLRTVLMASCEAAGVAKHHGLDILLDVPRNVEIPCPLKSVLVNLIVNAAEAMPGGGAIRITAIDTVDRVRIEVEDNGPGIPPEICGRLFAPFVTANKGNSLGLGLMLSRQTVRELGGDLWLEPALGARFIISLPRTMPAAADQLGERRDYDDNPL
jgi:two-component system phosphate regulon sensor histidine kinase PhoR